MPNPMEIMKLMGMWNTFKSNHPKFPKFMAAAAQPGVITEDTILEMKITTPAAEPWKLISKSLLPIWK